MAGKFSISCTPSSRLRERRRAEAACKYLQAAWSEPKAQVGRRKSAWRCGMCHTARDGQKEDATMMILMDKGNCAILA